MTDFILIRIDGGENELPSQGDELCAFIEPYRNHAAETAGESARRFCRQKYPDPVLTSFVSQDKIDLE